jgi:hypothetical protein
VSSNHRIGPIEQLSDQSSIIGNPVESTFSFAPMGSLDVLLHRVRRICSSSEGTLVAAKGAGFLAPLRATYHKIGFSVMPVN